MFAKVYTQIFDSSIAENYTVRHVFMDLLVLADSDGVVDMTIHAISRRTNVPVEIVRDAMRTLAEPDPESRSPDEEGRRIALVDPHREWGWRIINYDHYRKLRDEEGRRAYHRDYMREKRRREGVKPRKEVLRSVKSRDAASTHAEGEAEAEGRTSLGSSKENARWNELLKTYREAGVDVVKEERDARAWIVAHPSRKFTLDFFRNWLKRASEKLPPKRNKEEFVATDYQGPTAETFLKK